VHSSTSRYRLCLSPPQDPLLFDLLLETPACHHEAGCSSSVRWEMGRYEPSIDPMGVSEPFGKKSLVNEMLTIDEILG